MSRKGKNTEVQQMEVGKTTGTLLTAALSVLSLAFLFPVVLVFMLAKGWLLGIQFEELFSNNLLYDLAAHANEMSAILRKGIEKCGYPFLSDSMNYFSFTILLFTKIHFGLLANLYNGSKK